MIRVVKVVKKEELNERRGSQSDVEVRCKCGGKVCVCPVDLKETNWWAHCRDCDNAIEITETKQEAIDAWAELNRTKEGENEKIQSWRQSDT